MINLYLGSRSPDSQLTAQSFRVKIGRQFHLRQIKQAPLILVEFLKAVTGREVILDQAFDNPDLLLLSGLDLREAFAKEARCQRSLKTGPETLFEK